MSLRLTSKERLLRAINYHPTDHIPLLLRFWSLGGEEDNIPFNWRDEVERVKNTTALGLDDTIQLEPPLGYVENYTPELLPDVQSTTELLPPEEGEKYPRLRKIYETPSGQLQTIVVKTEDWPYDRDVHLFDDYNIPRLKEPLIKDEKDIPGLKYLLGEPTEQHLIEFRERARYLREQAERLGVLLDGGWSALGDAVMWLCGMERVLYGQMDCPQFIEKVLEAVFEWEMRRIEWLLEEGIDVMVHMAWYEGTDFWTPKNYRKMLKPRLMAMIEKVHAHGVKFRYIISRGWKPLMKDFLEMGIDCLAGVDPVQDKIDLREIKREIGGQICLMGGLNSAVMLNLWSEEQIRNAVREAVEILSPGGGAILFPVDAVFNNTPWEKVEILMDQWRKMW